MLTIKCFEVNPIQENTYVVSDETKEAVIIDCGTFYSQEHQALITYLRNEGLKLRHLLCTHGHLDHCFGNYTIYKELGVKAEVMADDEFLITRLDEQARNMFGFELEDEVPPVGRYLSKEDIIGFGHHHLTVIPTPGHTPGSCVFFCEQEQVAFTGDTLFHLSVGRTDFERGSYLDLIKSMQLLRQTLPGTTKLYPGHGGSTTMSIELANNPYLGGSM